MFVSASKYKGFAASQLSIIHQADEMRRCAVIGFYLANILMLINSVYAACVFVVSIAASYFMANLVRHYGYVAGSMSREFDSKEMDRQDTLRRLVQQFQIVTKLARCAQVQAVFWLVTSSLIGPIIFLAYMMSRKSIFADPWGMGLWTTVMFIPSMVYGIIALSHHKDLSYLPAAQPHTSAENMRQGQEILFSVEPANQTLTELMT